MKKALLVTAGMALSLLFLVGMYPSVAPAAEAVFTKYNIHVQGKADRKGVMVFSASYANWTDPGEGHVIVPPNTQVALEKGGGHFWEKGFTLIIQNPEKFNPPIGKVFFEYDAKRMGMPIEKYVELITSPTPVSLGDYSAKDQEGIKEGKALVGMTKKGVVAALGYPAIHETPSLDAGSYVYWRNRMVKVRVDFNNQGSVVSVN